MVNKGVYTVLLLVAALGMSSFQWGPSVTTNTLEEMGASQSHVSEFVQTYTEKALKGASKGEATQVACTILEVSRKYGFDPILLLAVIENESQFNPEAMGGHGEIGLMQIKPDTAEWIAKKAHIRWSGAASLQDPSANIRIGAAYLAMLRTKFKTDKDLYLAAYNMGVTSLNRALKFNTIPVVYAQKTSSHYSRIYTEFLDKGEKAASVARTYAAI